MSMGEAIRSVLQGNYANFNGRARRSEYWYFYLAVIIGYIVAAIVAGVISSALGSILYLLLFLGTFVPLIAVGSRRMHDTGKSGWMQLIGLVPLVGGIVLIVFFAQDSHGENKYGPSPKALTGYPEPGYPAV